MYIEYEVEMKALVYGQKNIYNTLSASLKNEGIEMHKLGNDFKTATNLIANEKYDLAIVDSRSDNAINACHYIRENWNMPLILVVDSLQADWKWLKSIEADGYIPFVKKSGELSARARALLRRLLPRNNIQVEIPGE